LGFGLLSFLLRSRIGLSRTLNGDVVEIPKYRLKENPRQSLRNRDLSHLPCLSISLLRSVESRHYINVFTGRSGTARAPLVVTRDAGAVVEHRPKTITTV
jgi:hypothetical protein